MARYRTNTERVAETISDLKWREMMSMSRVLCGMLSDRADFDFGNPICVAELLSDWAESVEDSFAEETQKKDG